MAQTNLSIFLVLMIAACATTAAHADVLISSNATQNMNCSGGVCSPTAPDAVLNVDDLANMLAGGDMKVTNGSGAVNIYVVAGFTWASTSRLTLEAENSKIVIQAQIAAVGGGGLTLNYNPKGPGGDLSFPNSGNVAFSDLKSSLIINANHYILAGNIATLAYRARKNPLGYYALANDYDASLDGVYAKSPIAYVQGVIEGLGHTISNLQIEYTPSGHRSADVGFVSENKGTIRDVLLTNEFVSGGNAGGLVGDNLGVVTHVSVSGSVQTTGDAGGVVAFTQGGVISYATAAVSVQGGGDVGGLVGATDGTIISCHATGSVSAQFPQYVGGLAGQAPDVSFSSATGDVSAPGSHNPAFIGGLIGYPSNIGGQIIQSYATGSVTGGTSDYVGGLAATGGAEDTYSTGNVEGGDQSEIGGFAVSGNITSSYSTGLVTASNKAHGTLTKPYIGGFVVFGSPLFARDYWDVDTSGTNVGCGYKDKRCKSVTGLTDAQLKSALPKGFSKAIWGQNPNINNGYPYLLANPPQ